VPAIIGTEEWSQGEANRGLADGEGAPEVPEDTEKSAESCSEGESEPRPDLAQKNTKKRAKTGPGPEAKG
jgi:hypothetical protein